MFEYKTFSSLKKNKLFQKNEKMMSRISIDYIMRYDFINIFKIWNFKKNDVSDYRDVIFNENEFYNIYVTINLLNEKKNKTYVTYQNHSLSMTNDNDKKYWT